MRFTVTGSVTVGLYIEVDAENAEEAKRKAEEAGTPRLCHQCSSQGGNGGCWGISDGLGDEVEADDAVPA